MPELRTTTGQRVTISYDPKINALTFIETDWFADPIRSTAMPGKSPAVTTLGLPRNVVSLSMRRQSRRAA